MNKTQIPSSPPPSAEEPNERHGSARIQEEAHFLPPITQLRSISAQAEREGPPHYGNDKATAVPRDHRHKSRLRVHVAAEITPQNQILTMLFKGGECLNQAVSCFRFANGKPTCKRLAASWVRSGRKGYA
ncbi:hypothetical protein SKAU_G00258020 [Synaphobranchus kaupii]|uniref:Uncharacterized protein n=1 Tax=Synaphobranchus kaupii TaxID=118154 RepID=A0A9Q1F4K6_SYNKA|nr:hypothetical protein SKAU_G00258020 [Synaphobranchus kaupii]